MFLAAYNVTMVTNNKKISKLVNVVGYLSDTTVVSNKYPTIDLQVLNCFIIS